MNVSVSWQTQSTSLFASSPFSALFVLRKSEHMARHKDPMQPHFSLQTAVLIQASVAQSLEDMPLQNIHRLFLQFIWKRKPLASVVRLKMKFYHQRVDKA